MFAQTPLAYYDFSGDAKDQIAGNNAAIYGSQLAADRFGNANQAFFFDGEQAFLEASSQSDLNTNNATVVFWVKPTTLPGQGEVYLISFGGWQERYKISLPSHGKVIWTTNNSSGISDMDAGVGNELVPGEWKHLAFVHDGTKDLIYVNGVQVAEKNVAGTLSSTTRPLGIGYNAVDKDNFFHGVLDEVMIFGSALSASEIAALYVAQSIAPPIPLGIVAEYRFEKGKFIDGSGLGNTAVNDGATLTTDRFGFGKSAYEFNPVSNSAITAANSSALNSANATISFWVRPNSFVGGGEAFLLSNGGWQERWKISLPNHGKPVFTTHNGGTCCSDMDSGTPLELGKWTHVVMTHDGTKDIIYFNGVKVNEKNVAGPLDPTSYPLGIGYDPIDKANYFDGAIDDIQIYNTALGESEVTSLYNVQNDNPGGGVDLVAIYPLDGSAEDESAFKNSGNLNASATTNRFGWANNAVNFDGTAGSGIWAENSSALNSDYTTILFWVKPTEFPASGEVYLLSNGGWQQRLKISLPSHGKPVLTTHSGGACCSDLDSGTPLTLGTWTHVAMVHDGTKDIIYFNGVKVNEKNASGSLDDTKYPLGIGYDPIDNGSHFNGAIDDLQIYNRPLSDAEIASLFATQNQMPTIPPGLVAQYTFYGNPQDQTVFKNHALVNGAQLTTDRFGASNQAYAFNGTNQGLVAANSPQHNSNYASISFWVNPKTFPASGEAYLLSNGGWQERWKISLPSHGRPVFTTHAGGACCSDMDSGTPLALDTWTHVVMVHDGTKDIIYFNGNKVNEKAVVGNLDSTSKPFGIGFDPIDNANYFNGALDEVRLYNVALTDSEVTNLYNQESIGLGPNPYPLCAPMNLTAEVEFTDITLSWIPGMDDFFVWGYNVYQDGELIATTSETQYRVGGLPQLTTFEFAVSALDSTGAESLRTYLKVTSGEDQTPDVAPPSEPANLQASTGANSVLFSWDASTDDRGVEGYVVFLDGILFDTIPAPQTSVFIGGLTPETPYTLEVYAFDKAGNNSTIGALDITTDEEVSTGELGMVAHYPFEGNANDATPYANHGVPGGDVAYINADHANGGLQAVKFDGQADTIVVPNAVQLISDYATVAFWIRVDGQNVQDAEAYILDFGHWDQRWKISLPQHLKIVWTTNSNNAQFPVFISDMDSGDGNELVKNFWWHVVLTHDGTDDKIYVNGQLANSKPVLGKLNTTARPLGIGGNPIDGGQYFNGALDELKIYNRAVTSAEAENLFNTGTTGLFDLVQDGLQGWIDAVYPVPSVGDLYIKHQFDGRQPLMLRVYDIQGRQIDQIRYDQHEVPSTLISIKTSAYPQGQYFLNFVLDGKSLGSVKFDKK